MGITESINILIGTVTILYFIVAILFGVKGTYPLSVVYLAYGIGNVAFMFLNR